MKEVKKYAAERSLTLTGVIEEALREKLARQEHEAKRRPFKLITHHGGGLQPGVDLDDNSALLDLIDGIE